MVRRLLEELCEDNKASGSDLKARLAAVRGTVVIPQELLTAADELRILGNDAVHVEAKAYDAIGSNEAALLALVGADDGAQAKYPATLDLDRLMHREQDVGHES